MQNSEKVDVLINKVVAECQAIVRQVQAVTNGRRKNSALVIGIASLLFVSCSPMVVQTPTPMYTETPMATATIRPTETATPTPEVGIDQVKLHNIPPSYEYLQSHLNSGEYIQSPDPVGNPEVFDTWLRELLVPALGPHSEREVNYYTDGLSNNYEEYTAENNMTATDNQIVGQPEFFYFRHNGVIFPVLVVNVTGMRSPDDVDITFCVAMFNDSSGVGMYGTSSLELFQQESANVAGIYIHGKPVFRGFPIGGVPGSMIEAMGRRYWGGDDRVVFGLGQIAIFPLR